MIYVENTILPNIINGGYMKNVLAKPKAHASHKARASVYHFACVSSSERWTFGGGVLYSWSLLVGWGGGLRFWWLLLRCFAVLVVARQSWSLCKCFVSMVVVVGGDNGGGVT